MGDACQLRYLKVPNSPKIDIIHNDESWSGPVSEFLLTFSAITNGQIGNKLKDCMNGVGIACPKDTKLNKIISSMIIEYSEDIESQLCERLVAENSDLIVLFDAR